MALSKIYLESFMISDIYLQQFLGIFTSKGSTLLLHNLEEYLH